MILSIHSVQARVTRDHGETANDKVNELLEALAVAISFRAFSIGGVAAVTFLNSISSQRICAGCRPIDACAMVTCVGR